MGPANYAPECRENPAKNASINTDHVRSTLSSGVLSVRSAMLVCVDTPDDHVCSAKQQSRFEGIISAGNWMLVQEPAKADLVITWYETTACFFNFKYQLRKSIYFQRRNSARLACDALLSSGCKNTKVRKSSLRARHTAGFCVTYRKYALFASSKVPSSRF